MLQWQSALNKVKLRLENFTLSDLQFLKQQVQIYFGQLVSFLFLSEHNSDYMALPVRKIKLFFPLFLSLFSLCLSCLFTFSPSCSLSPPSLLPTSVPVLCFNRRLGAAHFKHWLKFPFLMFFKFS